MDNLVIKRDGTPVPFLAEKIKAAITQAFLKDAQGRLRTTELGQSARDKINRVTEAVVKSLFRTSNSEHIEAIQDQVELNLMRIGEHEVARDYILYRELRKKSRDDVATPDVKSLDDGRFISARDIAASLEFVADGLKVNTALIGDRAIKDLFNGADNDKYRKAILLAVRSLNEQHPDYMTLAARVALFDLYRDVLGEDNPEQIGAAYTQGFKPYIERGVELGMLDHRLKQFDLDLLAQALCPKADYQFDYLGFDTLYDRYLLHKDGVRFELPQYLFMRVAMGLALNESDNTGWAVRFYNLLSSFDFMSSTPTLFNAGTVRPQLSSCYLSTIGDDLDAIYDGIKDNALLAKFAGGLGNDWTPVRAMGSWIKGTNGRSQGVIPFLKVVNDTAVAVNQGGKRKGAVCAYLETWHLDIEEFLDLRKNTGDDRRRTHDMNTANWIPDLFMKRVMENGDWTLFSPSDVPDLHDLYGRAFEIAYVRYEQKADAGDIKLFKRIPAASLWRKILTMIFETGHPWITFKDPCNFRSPQQHVGVVHSSNLCTEITLNTSRNEIAVCNLGSVNLARHLKANVTGSQNVLDYEKIKNTVSIAMRMLDNVIDINFYNSPKARNANLKHRPVGLGIMGFQDVLNILNVPYDSDDALEVAERSMEYVAYSAYAASNTLASERGKYQTYAGSLWSKGIFPHNTMQFYDEERGIAADVSFTPTLDWDWLRQSILKFGMRNSNCIAIAPTATIANIVNCSQSIDPTYQQLYVKSNLGGEYVQVNAYLVKRLESMGLWDDVMVSDLKYYDGSLSKIDRIPEDVKRVFKTAFEVDPIWLVKAAAKRQVWIDQAQSLNLYMAGASGKKLDELYKAAWLSGLKTTYYLRTIGATSAEKSTGRGGELQSVIAEPSGQVCVLRPGDEGFESCESCQ